MPFGYRIFLFLSQAFESHTYAVPATLHGRQNPGQTSNLHVKSLLITSQGVNQVIPVGLPLGCKTGPTVYCKWQLGNLFHKTFQVLFLATLRGKYESVWAVGGGSI